MIHNTNKQYCAIKIHQIIALHTKWACFQPWELSPMLFKLQNCLALLTTFLSLQAGLS